MKPNYVEKSNSTGKYVLIIVSKWVICYFQFICISLLKLAGKFSRLTFSAALLSESGFPTINWFLSSTLFTRKFPFLKTGRIPNRINPTFIKMTAVFAVLSYLSKVIRETVIESEFKSILSKDSCSNQYINRIFISNTVKKVLKLMPAGLA